MKILIIILLFLIIFYLCCINICYNKKKNYPAKIEHIVQKAIFFITKAKLTNNQKSKLLKACNNIEVRKGKGFNHTINKQKIVLYNDSASLESLIHELAHIITLEYGHTNNFYTNLSLIKRYNY